MNVDHLPEEEESKHVVRVGFSIDAASTQLGKLKSSYTIGYFVSEELDSAFTETL